MKKYLLLIFLVLFSFSATNAQIEWTLSKDSVLTISGKGDMPNYTDVPDSGDIILLIDPKDTCFAPWYPQKDKIKKLVIEDGVTSIGRDAFSGCVGLTSITIPNSVTSIGFGAFRGCIGLTSVTMPNSVTSIGNGAFRGCIGLTSITIPNSMTSTGYGAFSDCIGLISVTIPNSVTSIGAGAFNGCTSLASITIPNSVTSIEGWAFEKCTSLTSITIPNSVTFIGYKAFNDCSNLTSISFEGTTPPQLAIDALEYVKRTIPIYVPAKSIKAYRKALKDYFEESSIQALQH